ncbi:MAG TPA: DNA-3-methyladenine glycosylase [Kofleriaceae bacterium]|nr:DNA-3-methyladenine glycosylase [Kofleriaceae bacterium]
MAGAARSSRRARSASPKASEPAPDLHALAARRLGRAFFDRDVALVARELIGCVLVHGPRALVIVETEAYYGPEDLASHARFGTTARTAPMFGPPGHAYVYVCYGAHQMFNVVTQAAGIASAVLIRGAAPLCGLEDDPTIARGPGKVGAALQVSRQHSGQDLTTNDALLFVASDPRRSLPHRLADAPPAPELVVGPRVGVSYAGPWAAAPLRFAWRGHPSVSRPVPETPWP